MTPSSDPTDGQGSGVPGWVTGVMVLESIALGIAIVTPVTPSKTGSTWSPASLFSPDPSYLEKVGASFLAVNLLLLLLGMIVWLVSKRNGPESSGAGKDRYETNNGG